MCANLSTLFSFLVKNGTLVYFYYCTCLYKKLLLFSESQSYHPLKSELWNTVFLTQMNEISGTTFVFHIFFLPKQTEVLSNTRLQEKVQNCQFHKERRVSCRETAFSSILSNLEFFCRFPSSVSTLYLSRPRLCFFIVI